MMRMREARAGRGAGAILLALLVSCGAPPSPASPATIEIPAPSAAPETAVKAPAPFYLADPTLDGLEPPARWTVRQETFGSTDHCYELFYPESLLGEVADWLNAELTRRGFAADLPKSVLTVPLVVHLADKGRVLEISPRLAPLPPLIKLVMCHRGTPPVAAIQEPIARLLARPAARELAALGKPYLAWKREYRDRPPEYGFGWSNAGKDKIASVLVPLGYVETFDATKRRFYWRRGEQAFGWTPSTDLWWDAVEERAP